MANILDVSPVNRTVKTHRYGDLEVSGLSIEGLVVLVKMHPEVLDLFKGENMTLELTNMLELGLEVAAGFLAAGLGSPGNPDVIAKCKGMNAEDVWLIGNAIVEESFPGGASNFFDRVTAIAKEKGLVSLKPVQEKAA